MVRSKKTRQTHKAKRMHHGHWSYGHWLGLFGIFLLVGIVSFAVMGMGASLILRVAKASYGTTVYQTLAEGRPALRLMRTVKVVASAYSSSERETDASPCITANGFDVCQNYLDYQTIDTVATNDLPFGTVVKFPSLFPNLTFTVRDRMNARYGAGFIDIWMPMRADAVAFGRRVLDMEIYEPAME